MTAQHDPDRVIRAFLAEGRTDLPDRVYDHVRAAVDRTRPWPRVGLRGIARAMSFAGFAMAATVAILVGVLAFSGGLAPGLGGPAASTTPPSPEPTHHEILGLPFPPPTPGEEEPGVLVLSLDGSLTGTANIRVFADGLLVWTHMDAIPPSGPSSGFYQQRLSPSGVEFLRSAVLATGLFEHDLALARPTDAPFLSIQVRNGDQLVRLTWAVRENYMVGPDTPVATTAHADALNKLNALLTAEANWPASAWADREITPYIPSGYAICFRPFDPSAVGVAPKLDNDQILEWLPETARDILLVAAINSQADMPSLGGCFEVTTADAYTVAEALDGAGVTRFSPNRSWLKYHLDVPGVPGQVVWITFGALGPDGHANYTGPG